MKEKMIISLFLITIYLFLILEIVIPDKDLSFFERRKLMGYEQFKENRFSNLDIYMMDQFPFRENFISMNAIYKRYILRDKGSNGIYIDQGYIFEKNYPINSENIQGFIQKVNYITENYLQNNRTFYTIIPDKNYFLDDDYLKLDYSNFIDDIKEQLNLDYIDLVKEITLADYFKTDIHIKQAAYFKWIQKLAYYYDFSYQDISYQKNIYPNFYGSSYSKASKLILPDTLEYFSNDQIEKAEVNHLEYGRKNVYEPNKLGSMDSYDVFLSGASSIVEIRNQEARNKELILFRDSFASSLAPLLIPYYQKITLIDLRYISMDQVLKYVDFNDSDVLFMYSTFLINNSHLLKVKIGSS